MIMLFVKFYLSAKALYTQVMDGLGGVCMKVVSVEL